MADLPKQTGEISVDLNTFDGLIQRLKVISDFVQYDLTGQFNRELVPKASDQNILGEIPEGQNIMARASTNIQKIQQEMATLQGVLQGLVEQTNELHRSYKTLEQKNAADIAKVKALLDKPAAITPPGVPPQA